MIYYTVKCAETLKASTRRAYDHNERLGLEQELLESPDVALLEQVEAANDVEVRALRIASPDKELARIPCSTTQLDDVDVDVRVIRPSCHKAGDVVVDVGMGADRLKVGLRLGDELGTAQTEAPTHQALYTVSRQLPVGDNERLGIWGVRVQEREILAAVVEMLLDDLSLLAHWAACLLAGCLVRGTARKRVGVHAFRQQGSNWVTARHMIIALVIELHTA